MITVLCQLPSIANDTETYLLLSLKNDGEYDFAIGNGGGTILAHPALYYADRIDREDSPSTDMAIYLARGREIAQSVHFGGAVEYLAAWLNEDRKQGNMCHDIHAALSLNIFEKLPKWIKHDLFSILESEAMKQIFATRYLVEEKREGYKIPSALRHYIKNSSEGKTDSLLSDLMAETMQKPLQYNGSAKTFDNAVQARIQLFRDTLNG